MSTGPVPHHRYTASSRTSISCSYNEDNNPLDAEELDKLNSDTSDVQNNEGNKSPSASEENPVEAVDEMKSPVDMIQRKMLHIRTSSSSGSLSAIAKEFAAALNQNSDNATIRNTDSNSNNSVPIASHNSHLGSFPALQSGLIHSQPVHLDSPDAATVYQAKLFKPNSSTTAIPSEGNSSNNATASNNGDKNNSTSGRLPRLKLKSPPSAPAKLPSTVELHELSPTSGGRNPDLLRIHPETGDKNEKSTNPGSETLRNAQNSSKPLEKDSGVFPAKTASILSFLQSELLLSEDLGEPLHNNTIPHQLVYNFLILPSYLEQLVIFGIAVCLDSFLYIFTFLPLRCALAVILKLWKGRKFRNRDYRDLMRLFVLICCWFCLSYINMSRVYHYIRGQSVLKLYVIYNMLQVSDKLFCSFGEDILDSLFLSIQTQQTYYLAFHSLISLIYVFLHALLLFTQVITLNVSVNSDNSSLFILLISNNFVELKGAVFKRFDPNNLLQLTCADIVERFQLIVYLFVILLQNLSAIGLGYSAANQWIEKAIYMCAAVLGAEMCVDWIKHGFITKFNSISPVIYKQFNLCIVKDLLETYSIGNNYSDIHNYMRRLGLPAFPIAVLVMRVVVQSISNMQLGAQLIHIDGSSSTIEETSAILKFLFIIALLLVLFLTKILLSVLIWGYVAKKQQSNPALQPEKLESNAKIAQDFPNSASTSQKDAKSAVNSAVPSSAAPLSQPKHQRTSISDSFLPAPLQSPLNRTALSNGKQLNFASIVMNSKPAE
jgi:hypothetical protein